MKEATPTAMWKDVTSYRQSERGTKPEPRKWEAKVGPLRVSIHRFHGAGPVWFVTCHDLQMSARELKSPGIEDARKEGALRVRVVAQSLLDAAARIVEGDADG